MPYFQREKQRAREIEGLGKEKKIVEIDLGR